MSDEQDVTPQSSSGTPDPGTPAPEGNTGSQGGRGINEVYGEFSRKYTQLGERLEALQGMIVEGFKKLDTAQPAAPRQPAAPAVPGPVSPFGAPRPLEQFSDEHIAAYLADPTLTAYQRQVLESEKAVRSQQRSFHQMFDQRMDQQRRDAAKEQAAQAAFAAFPALRDQNSEFSQKVKAEIARRQQLWGSTPSEAYDAANTVAREMGLEITRAVTPGTFTASGFQSATPQAPAKPKRNELTDTDIERIGNRLKDALPSDRQADGRMKRRDWNKKRVKERSKMYAENADLYRHTKLGADE